MVDVGCGDGLIGFRALEKWKTSRVIFTDISQDLLTHAQTIAKRMDLLTRCEFACVGAEALSVIGDASVDAVTTRSVLIYVKEKRQAFQEFYRVLKPNGRISLFEPNNTFGHPVAPHIFWGYDVTSVVEIAEKIKAVYHRIQPPGKDPMLDFDERRLLELASETGFKEVYLELHSKITPPTRQMDWDTFLRIAGNPRIPTLEEAMQEALTPTERESFVNHLRPLHESRQGVIKSSVAYLWAVK